jgi:hypothetical protein
MLRMFCNGFQMFSGVFASVSDACFKCFIYLLLYIANVASECSKIDLNVAYMYTTLGTRQGMGRNRGWQRSWDRPP